MITIANKGKYNDWLTDSQLLRVKGWARDGLIDEQIAHNMGIAYSTFRKWVEKYPEFADALKSGKEPVDIQVENALLKSALGYTIKLMKPIKVKTRKELKDKGTIEEEHIEYAEEEIHIPPQVTAQIFWLKNRKPLMWRDRRETEIDSKEAVKVIVDV